MASSLKKVEAYLRDHPFLRFLAWLGGVGGGVAVLYAIFRWLCVLFFPQLCEEPSTPDPQLVPTVTGRVCPGSAVGECLDDNKNVAIQLESATGKIAFVDLKIDWNYQEEYTRTKQCKEEFTFYPDVSSYAPGWTIIDIVVDPDSCEQEHLISFTDEIMSAGKIHGGSGGAEYRIKGTFLIGVEELAGNGLPTALWKSWYQFKKQN